MIIKFNFQINLYVILSKLLFEIFPKLLSTQILLLIHEKEICLKQLLFFKFAMNL